MSRYHEEQHFHGAIMGLLLVVMIFVVVVTVVAVVFSRPGDALLLAIAPVVVVLVASLISLSRLDVDVTDQGVSIAFRYLWPTRRIAFGQKSGARWPQVRSKTSGKTSMAMSQRTPSHCPAILTSSPIIASWAAGVP